MVHVMLLMLMVHVCELQLYCYIDVKVNFQENQIKSDHVTRLMQIMLA